MIISQIQFAHFSNLFYVCGIIIALKNILIMEKEQKFKKMVFKDYYTSLSDAEKETLRNFILSESGMSYTTFYYKLRNNSFKPLEDKLIQRILEKEFMNEEHIHSSGLLEYRKQEITNEQFEAISRILSSKR